MGMNERSVSVALGFSAAQLKNLRPPTTREMNPVR
jgi:hypothetical protein